MLHSSRQVYIIIASVVALAFAAGTEARCGSATQTVSMVITGASVFDVQPAGIDLGDRPISSRGTSALAEASSLSRYTVVGPRDGRCILSAALDEAAAMPTGSWLELKVRPASGGSPAPADGARLSGTARSVLTVSGSSATGPRGADGARFTYTLNTGSSAGLRAVSLPPVAVTLTLTDAS
jgi:hypothetical protein